MDAYTLPTAPTVAAFSPRHSPKIHSFLETYIHENEIIGTHAGSFGHSHEPRRRREGNIYVVDQGNKVDRRVHRRGGSSSAQFTGPAGSANRASRQLTGVAVDPTNGNVLIVDSGHGVVDEFSASGKSRSNHRQFPRQRAAASPSTPKATSTSPTRHRGRHLLPHRPAPKVTYRPRHRRQPRTSGTLNATVEPNLEGAKVTDCDFEYGTTTSYGHRVPALPTGRPLQFRRTKRSQRHISGLTPETTYHYRVVLHNADGIRTAPTRPIHSHHVVGIEHRSGDRSQRQQRHPKRLLLGNGEETHYYFEWGTTTIRQRHRRASREAGLAHTRCKRNRFPSH